MIDSIVKQGLRGLRAVLSLADLELTRASRTAQARLLGLGSLPVRTILDVGANIGQFASRMRRVFPSAEIHCFEPVPAALDKLNAWARSQGSRVHVHPCALGASPGDVEMHQHTLHTASSSMLPTTAECVSLYPYTAEQRVIQVRQSTLDAEMAACRLAPLTLLKLDVQGYEAEVLRGADATLPLVDACITEVNIALLYDGQPSFRWLVDYLGTYGLEFHGLLDQSLDDRGAVSYCDAVFGRTERLRGRE
jgi:FkbM family methyltransferase